MNPYLLAQYIVTNPETKKEFNFLDADPILAQLPAKLMGFTVELLFDKSSFLKMLDEEHPYKLLQSLAQRADELCPGRSYSDLLYKQIVVFKIFETITQGLAKAILGQRFKTVSFSLQRFESLAKQMDDLRKSSTL